MSLHNYVSLKDTNNRLLIRYTTVVMRNIITAIMRKNKRILKTTEQQLDDHVG